MAFNQEAFLAALDQARAALDEIELSAAKAPPEPEEPEEKGEEPEGGMPMPMKKGGMGGGMMGGM